MKKLLLSFAAACVVTAASAAVDFTYVWSPKTIVGTATFNAPVAFDSKGNIVTVAPADLGASLLVLSKADGTEVLKCGIDGAVTVTSVAVDASDNIYLAGTLADEVVFSGKDNSSVTLNGMEIDGAATIEQFAAFIVKYSTDGKAVKGVSFVPSLRDEYDFLFAVSEPKFSINHLKVDNNTIYASAIYKGITTPTTGAFKEETVFDSDYYCSEGWMIGEFQAVSIFALDNNLTNGTVIADIKAPTNFELDLDNGELFEALSVSFDVKAGTVYAGFVGYGDLTISAAGKDTKFNSDATNRDVTFLYATFTSAGLDKILGSAAFADANKEATNLINTVLVDDANTVFGIGNLHSEEGEGDATTKISNLMVNKVADGVEITTVKQTVAVSATVESEQVSSAAFLPSGEIAVSALNFFNMAASEKKGEFAGSSNAYIFDGKDFVKAADFVNPIAFVSKGESFAASAVVEGGVAYTLYTAKTAGIADIVADENAAEAEYFNLQGVRVANPENGLYIVRRGNTVTKELLRK